MANDSSLEFSESINQKIYKIRGQQVMLDRDLAALYGVETRVLNQAVRRNLIRFPADFMFQLTGEEMSYWMSQAVISNAARMGLRKKPFAFTEHGILMLSSVLSSAKAVEVNIQIMRIFVRLRREGIKNLALLKKIVAIEKELADNKRIQGQFRAQIKVIFQAIQHMFELEEKDKAKKIGFLK